MSISIFFSVSCARLHNMKLHLVKTENSRVREIEIDSDNRSPISELVKYILLCCLKNN